MHMNALHHESSALVLEMLEFGGKLYATDPGADHPTPPAPDRRKSGNKPKPKTAPKKKKKK